MLPVDRFNAYIQQNQLFDNKQPVLAAVSGGIDSVVMVHLLKAAGYKFGIAHCNFMLRGAEADAEQQFCHLLAQNLGVPFYTINFETNAYAGEQKISVQMAARQLRYQWFEELRAQHRYDCIALAHHQNDAIETILLNLVRGTGIAGLHGILPKSNYLVRPLLFLNRTDIIEIAGRNDISYLEDSSNASTKYARNKLRHQVIPQLKELNPGLEQTFERNLLHFRALEEMLAQQVAIARKDLFMAQDDEVHIPINGVQKLYPQRLLMMELLKPFSFNDTAVDDLLSALTKHSGRVFESATHRVWVDRERLIITPRSIAGVATVELYQDSASAIFGTHTINIHQADSASIVPPGKNIAAVDALALVYPLRLRTWQQGDTFVPLGMKGNKKLSDFFIGQKIPLHQKTQIPILVNGNNEIIWVAGHRLDDRYKLTPQTKKVVIFELL